MFPDGRVVHTIGHAAGIEWKLEQMAIQGRNTIDALVEADATESNTEKQETK